MHYSLKEILYLVENQKSDKSTAHKEAETDLISEGNIILLFLFPNSVVQYLIILANIF